MKEFIENLISRLEERKKHFGTLVVVGKDDLVLNYNLGKMHSFEDSIEIINQLAEEYINCSTDTSTNTSSGWIPCSRELPPQPKENPEFDNKALQLYLVSDGYSDYPFRAFWNGKFFVDGFSHVDVIAWMPLPEPFTPKEGRE